MIYALVLKIRHLFYDLGWIKSVPTELPSVCVGNVGVGGTGKTPMTELIIKTIQEGEVESADAEIYGFEGSLFAVQQKSVAVVSRGYRRSTRGFQVVSTKGTASQFGDEPMQIKRKFPDVAVVVDEDRNEAADFLAHPSKLKELEQKKLDRILYPRVSKPDIIILDDAFQHRKTKASKSIVLTTYSRPYFKDHLLPWGRLRDLRSRADAADMIVVTKCPPYINDMEKALWARKMGVNQYDVNTCGGKTKDGRDKKVLFATTVYDKLIPVFKEGDPRYIHSKLAILVTGIADDTPFAGRLGETYKLVDHRQFGDHHNFTDADIQQINAMAVHTPTAIVITTEKDAMRFMDKDVPDALKFRMFYAPIRTQMLTAGEQTALKEFLNF